MYGLFGRDKDAHLADAPLTPRRQVVGLDDDSSDMTVPSQKRSRIASPSRAKSVAHALKMRSLNCDDSTDDDVQITYTKSHPTACLGLLDLGGPVQSLLQQCRSTGSNCIIWSLLALYPEIAEVAFVQATVKTAGPKRYVDVADGVQSHLFLAVTTG